MDEDFQSLSNEEKLRVSVFSNTRKICREVGEAMKVTYDKNSLELISEFVWKKMKIYSEDLEAFARHGKRMSVNADDVKLLVRQNSFLKEHMNKVIEERSALAAKQPKKKRGKRKAENDPVVPEEPEAEEDTVN